MKDNLQMACSESVGVKKQIIMINIAESISDMKYMDVTWVGHKRAHRLTSLADLRHAALLSAPPLRCC